MQVSQELFSSQTLNLKENKSLMQNLKLDRIDYYFAVFSKELKLVRSSVPKIPEFIH